MVGIGFGPARRGIVVLAAAAVLLAVAPRPAGALEEETRRTEATAFLAHFVHPIGALLDALVFAPVDRLTRPYEERHHGPKRHCRGFRPRRGCSRGR